MTEDGADRLANDLRRSIADFVRAVRQNTRTIRSAQSETLDILDRHGPMSVAALAEKRGVTHQTMRLVVSQMQVAGFVRQAANPVDRRSRLVSISATGRTDLEREKGARTSRIAKMIFMKLTSREQEQLQAAILIQDRLTTSLD